MSESIASHTAPVRVNLDIRLARFHLPPVESALAIGHRAPIGANAMAKALDEMMPGAFKKITVEHTVIEAFLVRDAHLRRVPEERLVPVLLRHVDGFMSDTEMLHVDIRIEVRISESIDL